MKRIITLTIIIVAGLLLFAGLIWLKKRSGKPEVLVERLRNAEKSEYKEIIMQLNLARGDTVTPIINAFNEPGAAVDFRCMLLELLYRKQRRAAEERISSVLKKSLLDKSNVVRLKSVELLSIYSSREDKSVAISCLEDKDNEVLKMALMVLGSGTSDYNSVYSVIDKDVKAEMLSKVKTIASKSSDKEIVILARSIIGRKVEELCQAATRAFQSSDIVKAEKLLAEAFDLDPGNHRAMIRQVRNYLANGEKEKAIKLAHKYKAIITIPELSKPPILDGDPEEDVWDEGFCQKNRFMNTSRWVAKDAEGKSKTYIGHKNGVIYFAVLGYEKNLDELVVKSKKRDGKTWEDDSVEIFLDPGLSEKNYCQFIINPIGTVTDLLGRKRSHNFKFKVAAKVFRERGYWACEFAVAAKDLNNQPIQKESIWGINVIRTRIGPASECCSLWPTYGSNCRPELFPIAVFDMGKEKYR